MRERCSNDNHGRMVVRVRCCPNCGEIVNATIAPRLCSDQTHLRMRRERSTYCHDCGVALRPAGPQRA